MEPSIEAVVMELKPDSGWVASLEEYSRDARQVSNQKSLCIRVGI